VNVGHDAAPGDGDVSKQLVQFLVVANSQLDMSWNDASSFVVTGSITSKFKDFCSEILQDSSKVYWGSSTNTSSIFAFL
jgi:hypothetical protein